MRERDRVKRREREITTVRARARDVIIINNTPPRGWREKGQEFVGQSDAGEHVSGVRDEERHSSERDGEKECATNKKRNGKRKRHRLHSIDIQKDR